ncbi:MAG: hypothetical protein ACYSTY_01975 [Planctomycetota bacterium]|jgi:hypothetical protein
MSETNPRFQPPADEPRGGSDPVDLIRQVIGEVDDLAGIKGSSPRSVVAHEQHADELDLIHKVISEIDDLADQMAAAGGAGAEGADELDFVRSVLGEPWRSRRGAPEAEGEEKRLISGAAPEDEPIPNVAQLRGSLEMPAVMPPKPEVVEFSAVAWPEQAELESPASAPVVESAGQDGVETIEVSGAGGAPAGLDDAAPPLLPERPPAQEPEGAPAVETPLIDEATTPPLEATTAQPAEPIAAAAEPELMPLENDAPVGAGVYEAPASATAHEAVDQVDQAIAEDLDALLQGGYESVDDVLRGVFEEQATLVQPADDAPAVVQSSDPAREEETPAASEPAPAPEAPPIASAFDQPPADPAVVTMSEPDSRSSPQPEPRAEPREPTAEPGPPQQARQPRERSGGAGMLWRTARPVVMVTLGLVNFPLRFVPASLRPIVDWIALSLVFWVPITWMIAMFLIGD